MKQQRLDGLADGIFAIVMTVLVFELRIPNLGERATDSMLWLEITKLWPVFMSLLISFALLFTYWRAHHFIASVYAKNVTVGFANLNGLFFMLIVLVPFTAHFLGEYPHSKVAIAVYGINVIAIGFSLFLMRRYVETNPEIETSPITKADRRSGYIRILFPVFAASVAIIVSYWNTSVSMFLFTISILFNLLPSSTNIIHKWLDLVFSDDSEILKGNFNGLNNQMNDEEYICVPKSAVVQQHTHKNREEMKKVEKVEEEIGIKEVVRKKRNAVKVAEDVLENE
jgi:uncharacterized membrane protein